ncbi:metalloregulator ArsR/SmtB family transcription factor [Terrarubrum flagellatum]|uniref:ArsR/SmtB family transcription factor n=1 Tax=Terrirubrum flagellatum TaxID=2895980 RepID=UPI003145367E
MVVSTPLSFEAVLSTLKAAGEETRLRIVALLAEGELSVSDLTDILGQSQPRISRHLKLLMDAGLATRNREGAFAFFRLETRGAGAPLAQALAGALDRNDEILAGDRARLAAVRAARAKAAEQYFSRHAIEWDRIRSLHVAESEVEQAIVSAVGDRPIHALLDLGAGTGRMLQLFAGRASRLVGVDSSPAMLQVARANLAKAGVRGVELRQGDIYALPVERNAFDVVIIHQVLHYLDDPSRALREAAASLAPGGRMIVADFAPHAIEELREKQSHRRLGFTPEEITLLMQEAGLDSEGHRDLPPPDGDASKLTVSIWIGRDRRMITDYPLQIPGREVA